MSITGLVLREHFNQKPGLFPMRYKDKPRTFSLKLNLSSDDCMEDAYAHLLVSCSNKFLEILWLHLIGFDRSGPET